jgi:hypothetical protein
MMQHIRLMQRELTLQQSALMLRYVAGGRCDPFQRNSILSPTVAAFDTYILMHDIHAIALWHTLRSARSCNQLRPVAGL